MSCRRGCWAGGGLAIPSTGCIIKKSLRQAGRAECELTLRAGGDTAMALPLPLLPRGKIPPANIIMEKHKHRNLVSANNVPECPGPAWPSAQRAGWPVAPRTHKVRQALLGPDITSTPSAAPQERRLAGGYKAQLPKPKFRRKWAGADGLQTGKLRLRNLHKVTVFVAKPRGTRSVLSATPQGSTPPCDSPYHQSSPSLLRSAWDKRISPGD